MKIVRALVGAMMLAAPAIGHAATTIVTDGSFEAKGNSGVVGNPTPVANYCYDTAALGNGQCAGQSAWTGNSGVIHTGEGAWGGTPAADGNYYAFVQGGGVLSQVVNLHVGQYTFSWSDAGRANYGAQTYLATIGGQALGSFTTQPGSAFAAHSVTVLIGSAGAKTLSFAGQVPADVTSFIDNVSISAVPEPGIWAMMIAGFGFIGAALRRRKTEALRFA